MILRKIKIFSFVLLIITIFSGCSNNSSEKTIENFITALYSVNQSDFDYYEKMTKGSNPSGVAENDKAYNANTQNFQQYLTKESYQSFFDERLSYLRIANAYNSNSFTKIKKLKIKKIKEDKNNNTISYKYEFQLDKANKDTKKIETTSKSGLLTVINENDTWKIIDKIVFSK